MNPLIRLIPPAFVRFFARPYVAGDSLAKAMEVAGRLHTERGLASTLDLLAEDIREQETVQRNIATYLAMIDAVAADGRFGGELEKPSLSLKLSSYTTAPLDKGGDASGARESVLRIVEYARTKGVRLTIDMESRHWTDFTIRLLEELHAAGQHHVGGVFQTRLHRTAADLARLPRGLRVRLVIGIYDEPESVAVRDKREMKERLLAAARSLLERGQYLEFATHDEAIVRRFLAEVVAPLGVPKDRFEVQMLYGVPRERLLAELRREGIRARLYVPFALGWPMAIAYLRRRLDEYPKMMFLVMRNVFSKG